MPFEALTRDRELSRLRMQRYRARKALQSPPPPPPSASQKKKLRAKWRDQKKRQREAMTPEEKKMKNLHDLKRRLDKLTSEEFAEVMTDLTPRKRQCITSKRNEDEESSVIDSLRAAASPLKKSQQWNSKRKLQFLVQAAGPKNVLNLRRETFSKYIAHDAATEYSRKDRKDKLSKEVVDEVHTFYKEHSRPLPIARQAGKSLLSDPIRNIHSEWNSDENKPALSQSMFFKLRPAQILTVDKTKFVGCQCEYCLNADYLVSDV